MPAVKLVACPHCGKKTPWNTNNAFRPFCSERCKMIDLGQWAKEEYRIPDTHPTSISDTAAEQDE